MCDAAIGLISFEKPTGGNIYPPGLFLLQPAPFFDDLLFSAGRKTKKHNTAEADFTIVIFYFTEFEL